MAKTSETERLKRYVEEVDRFAALLRQSQKTITEHEEDYAVKKAAAVAAKEALREAKEVEHATVKLLLRFITPGSIEICPLFDTMEPADEKKQGPGAKEWRKEPIAALGLSSLALQALIAHDIILVGQLQDKLLADSDGWADELEGITPGMAEAIAAKFYAFVEEHTK
jgi:hypothetical protein